MKVYKTQAIVLKKQDLLEKNLKITFFTKDFGKLKIFAYGIKKINSRRISSLQTGNLVQIIFQKKNDKFYLRESLLDSAFYLIKKNKEKTKFLYLFLFILDRILAEGEKEQEVYNLSLNFLVSLSKKNFSPEDFFSIVNLILQKLGFLQKKMDIKKILKYIEELINEKIPSYLKV